MLKHIAIYFVTLLITYNSGFSQSINDIENDSIVKIGQTDLSLIYNNKTTAVWHNLANFYVVEPTKNWFINLKSVNLLVEVDFKKKLFYAIVEDDLTGGFKRFLLGENAFNAHIFSCPNGCFLQNQLLKIDNAFFNLSLNKAPKKRTGIFEGKIGLVFKNKNLIVTDYKISRKNYSPIISTQYADEDSIKKGNKIYNEYDFDYTNMQSGVYNFRKHKWIIPRQYISIDYSKKEIITNSDSTNLKVKKAQVWRKKKCKWQKQSKSFSEIKRTGNIYICKTKMNQSNESSFVILDKNLKPLNFSDFYNFEKVNIFNDKIEVTPINNGNLKPFYIDFNGELITEL